MEDDQIAAIVQAVWEAGYRLAMDHVKQRLDRPLTIGQLADECRAIVDGEGWPAVAPNVRGLLRQTFDEMSKEGKV